MSGIKRTKADAEFSLMIRERANWRCQRCGSVHVIGSRGLHAAHHYTRRTQATRYDPDNALALCYGCHQYADSHPEDKRDLWRSIIGDERFEALSAKAHGKRDR